MTPEGYVKLWAPRLKLDPSDITVRVGDLSRYGNKMYGLTRRGATSGKYIIKISPKAEDSPSGLEHVIIHELVHVLVKENVEEAHDAEVIEWLIDLAATLFYRKYSGK